MSLFILQTVQKFVEAAGDGVKLFKNKNNDTLYASIKVLYHFKNTNPTPCPSLCHWWPP